MSQRLNFFIAVLSLVVALSVAWPEPARSRPPLGVTNFDSIHLSDINGTATPNLMANQRGSGTIIELRDASTPVFNVHNGGQADFHGNQIDIDADNDTSISADNDDQIDFEIGGADELRITTTGPAIVEASVIALSDGGAITPTTAYQPITSTAAVTANATTAIADGTVTGQLLILVNENASDAIIIPDAANTNLSGATTLGNDDTLWLIWDGADWLELGQADN